MALGDTLFKFERAVLIEDSRDDGRMYLVHCHRDRGSRSLALPSTAVVAVVTSLLAAGYF
jgi:hypothetical protein